MNEIPKLLKQTPTDIEYYCEDDLYIANKSLKEVNAFWDKYKDNMNLFLYNFNNKEYNWLLNLDSRLAHQLAYKDWLHDLLYKVE